MKTETAAGTAAAPQAKRDDTASASASLSFLKNKLEYLVSETGRSGFREDICQDFALRRNWKDLLDETEDFFTRHPPFDLVCGALPIKKKTDYQRETADLAFPLGLFPKEGSKLLGDIRSALWESGKMDDWGFTGWPETAGPDCFTSPEFAGFFIGATLLNSGGRLLGTSRITLRPSFALNVKTGPVSGPPPVLFLNSAQGEIVFRDIKAAGLSGTPLLKITRINGIEPAGDTAAAYMKVITGGEEKTKAAPPEMITVISGGAEISRRDRAGIFPFSQKSGRPSGNLTIRPFQISRNRVSYSLWTAVRSWAELRGYRFLNPGKEYGQDVIACNGSFDFPVTDILPEDALVWCNAFGEYSGTKPYYICPQTRRPVKDAAAFSAAGPPETGPAFAAGDQAGFRLPSLYEFHFALYGGDPELKEFDTGVYSLDKKFNEARIVPVRGLGCLALTRFSQEFIEPFPPEKPGEKVKSVYFFNRSDHYSFRLARFLV